MQSAQRRADLLWMTPVLLLGAALRLVGLTRPGLAHDEVAHWLIARAILDGRHSIYFTDAYGHEAGYHYVEALVVALVGDQALGLRLPAALFSLLGIAVGYRLALALTGKRAVARPAALILAVTFFPIFYGRLALRAVSYPVLAGLSAWQFWRGRRSGRLRPYLWAGLWGGLSLHTYMAARSLPIFYLFWMGLSVLLRPAEARRSARGWLLCGLAFAAVAAPLVLFLWRNPGAEFRVGEVDAPLRALLAGDWRPVAHNARLLAGMFGFSGDPLWRQNVAGRPVFEPLTAALFYGGVALALYRRRAADLFALLWIACAMLPSLATVDAPSTIRSIGLLPLLGFFPAVLIHRVGRLSTVYPQLSPEAAKNSRRLLLTVVLTLGSARAVWFTHVVWPAAPEVQFVWQTALTNAARALDAAADDASPVAVLGWSPDTMDPPTLALTLRRDDLSLRFFGDDRPTPVDVLIAPHAADGRFRLVRPAVRELDPALESRLAQMGATQTHGDGFVLYAGKLSAAAVAPAVPVGAAFDGELLLLGYDLTCDAAVCEALTTWRVLATPDGPRSLFLHLTGPDGVPVSQSDGLAAPARFWQVDDGLFKVDRLSLADAPADWELRLGVYNPADGRRLRTTDGADHIVLRPTP